MRKGGTFRELYWAVRTKRHAPGMSLFEYFCRRIVRTRNLPK